jgi:signal transduction histidine kinase
MAANMASYSNKWSGEYQENTYDILLSNQRIGTLTTGFVGPYYFNDEELIFIKALNTLFVMIGISSLVIAFTIGIFMSVKIANPLDKISKKALGLAEGKYKERLKDDSNTKEISILTDTINQLSDALESKDKLRKQLTQDVAHELRTPLTSVQGHMEAMIDGVWEMNVDRLSSCYEEIIRIKKLIGSIEDLSGVENDNLLLNKEEFNFISLVKRLLNNYHNELMAKNINVVYEEKEQLIYADKDKMSQILNNLISNSIKYSKEETKVYITCNIDSQKFTIHFKDTGIGIRDTDLPFIFERFYRADKSRSTQTGGVGIGLTITKAIVNAHGGDIEAKSVYGEGTEFIITLPNMI